MAPKRSAGRAPRGRKLRGQKAKGEGKARREEKEAGMSQAELGLVGRVEEVWVGVAGGRLPGGVSEASSLPPALGGGVPEA